MIDRRGVLSFLLITFGITYLLEGMLILSGFRVAQIPAAGGQFVIMLVMWVPAAATLITIRFITHETVGSTGLRFGSSWKPYAVTALVIPISFILVYLLTWALGLGQPDWQLTRFYAAIAATGVDMSTAPPPALLLIALFLTSLTINPIVNSLLGLGEEWGWRGYLLPRLMPVGKWKAYLFLGVIWGLWHAPLVMIGFNYPGYPILGVVLMVLFTTALSIFINELTLHYKSAILAGWIHGVFNSQAYGIWRVLLFENANPIWGGITGLVGISVLCLLGLVTIAWARHAETRPSQARHVTAMVRP
jgi:hypothetical protein